MTLARVEGFSAPGGEALDLDVARGEVVLLRGPNGSGKTSLLRALAGLDAPLAPRASTTRGLRAAELARAVALAPQHASDALCGLTVAGEARLRGRAALPDALAPLAGRDSATLSSGEARRVALALSDGAAPLLLLDEPAEALDAPGRAALRALVASTVARGGAVVAADHGALLGDLATRVVRLGGADEGAPLPDVPRRGDAIVLRAPASRSRGLDLPALDLPAGFHALVGPNGCGKTTLLLDVARTRAASLAWADPRAAFTRGSVAEELAGRDARVVDRLVPRALLPRHPLALSGGEAQRVSLAKALGARPEVILLDEPEAHLDASGLRALLAAVALRVADGACVLAATHDARLVERAHLVVRMGAAV